MKSGIFRKLFITYGITIIIGFGILALMLLKLFDQYFIENKKDLLLEQGRKITREIALGLYTGNLEQEKLMDDLQTLDKFLNAHIWIIDGKGTIFGVSGTESEAVLGQKIPESDLQKLISGKSIEERGTFGGKLKEPSLTVGYPIFVNNVFRGSVFVHASIPEVQKTFKDIYKLTIWAILLSVVAAYAILYFQIKRISEPLRQINEAAKVIAGGEFQKRLKIDTRDEIEELGHSFNHMAESLERIEENRRNLVANISHDLRSPMTSICGFIQGILDGTIPEDRQEHYLKIVLEESKRLMKITNELLELNNMQQGRIEVKKSVFELNEIIRRKLISFERRITEKKLEVALILHEEKNLVNSDQLLVERVITNLIDNAVKFTPEGGQVAIRTAGQADHINVELVNNGVTINAEELNRLWDRFHKGDPSRGEIKSGFGLGLAIVREIIGKLEEKIWVESEKDNIKFVFTLKKA